MPRSTQGLTHLAVAFAIAHPGVASAIIGPRTMQQLDDEILNHIDRIAPPGTDADPHEPAYTPPSVSQVNLRHWVGS